MKIGHLVQKFVKQIHTHTEDIFVRESDLKLRYRPVTSLNHFWRNMCTVKQHLKMATSAQVIFTFYGDKERSTLHGVDFSGEFSRSTRTDTQIQRYDRPVTVSFNALKRTLQKAVYSASVTSKDLTYGNRLHLIS
jgi:hypothetical protein